MTSKKVLTYKGYRVVIWQVNDTKWWGDVFPPGCCDYMAIVVGAGYLEVIEAFHEEVEADIKRLEKAKARLFDKLMRNQRWVRHKV